MKLTKFLRERIRGAAVARFVDPTKKRLSVLEDELACAALATFLGPYKETFPSLPADWFYEEGTIRWRLSNGTHREADFKTPRRLPNILIHGGACITDPEIEKAYITFRETRHKFEQERDSLRNKCDAVLYSVGTVKQLITAWPEVLEVYPDLKKEPLVYKLPAPRTDELNLILGLTPVVKAHEKTA